MQVPTMAIEKVFIYNNTSIIQDEVSWGNTYLHNVHFLVLDLYFGPIYVCQKIFHQITVVKLGFIKKSSEDFQVIKVLKQGLLH